MLSLTGPRVARFYEARRSQDLSGMSLYLYCTSAAFCFKVTRCKPECTNIVPSFLGSARSGQDLPGPAKP